MAAAETYKPSAPQVKAALLFNFARYVEWPKSYLPNVPNDITIGILGNNSLKNALEVIIDGKKFIGGKKITLYNFKTVAEIVPVHMLYIDTTIHNNFKQILEKISSDNILTVGEGFSDDTTALIIRFVSRDEHVRFEINLALAREKHIIISSALLSLADAVVD